MLPCSTVRFSLMTELLKGLERRFLLPMQRRLLAGELD